MKCLILMLLLAVPAQAQLADAARKERQRQSGISSQRVFTIEDAKGRIPPQGAAATSTAGTGATAESAVKPPVPAGAGTAEDPIKKYNEAVAKLRSRLQDLQNQEVQLQLQLNRLTNQFFAPVTDLATRDQAEKNLGETQNRLTALRRELGQVRSSLQHMEAQGPPASPKPKG